MESQAFWLGKNRIKKNSRTTGERQRNECTWCAADQNPGGQV